MNNSPFKFLDPYSAKDKAFFFGREKEVEALYQMTFKSPIILVYGYSGMGKTSLVKCGLAGKFTSADWLPLHIRRNENINNSLAEVLKEATPGLPPTTDLLTRCDELYTDYFRPIYLIFDQFEEVFILGDKTEQEQLVATINELLKADFPVKIILVMREEYLGSFYQFEKEIPYIFDYKLRVEQMNLERVKQVISTSFSTFNIAVAAPEEKQIEKIIQKVSKGKSGIKLPYLQVYLDELYKEDFARTYPNKTRSENEFPPIELTPSEIYAFGEIDDVLERFLQKQEQLISKKLVAQHPELNPEHIREIISNFITDDGTKKPVPYEIKEGILTPDETFTKDLPYINAKELADCLNALEQSRIIRFSQDTMELAHDSLAAIVFRLRDHELLKLKEVKNQLTIHYATHLDTGSYLNRKKLHYYEDYLPLLSLPDEIDKFISDSRRDVRKKEIIKILKSVGLVLLSITVVFGLFIGKKVYDLNENNKGAITNLTTIINDLKIGSFFNAEATNVLQDFNNDPTKAFKNANILIKNAEQKGMLDSVLTIQALLKRILKKRHIQPPYLKDIPLKKNILKSSILPFNDSLHYFISLYEKDSTIQFETWGNQFSSAKNALFKANAVITDYQSFRFNDQTLLATVTITGTIQIWSLEEGKLLLEKNIDLPIYCLASSTDEGELFIGTSRGLGRVRIKGERLSYHKLKSFKHAIKRIKTDPKNNKLALLTTSAQSVILINKHTLNRNYLGPKNKIITDMNFSNNGQQIAISYDNGKAGLWDLSTRKEVLKIDQQSIIQSIVFSPNDQFVLTGDLNNNVLLWTRDGIIFKEMIGHESAIKQVSFIDDHFIASTTARNIKLWNISSQAIKSYTLPAAVKQVDFSPNGEKIIACDAKEIGAFHLLDTAFNKHQLVLQKIRGKENYGKINALSFLNNNQILVGANNYIASIIDLQENTQVDFRPLIKFRTSAIQQVAANGDLVAIAHAKRIIIRDKNKPKTWNKALRYSAPVRSLVFSPSGKQLFVGYENGIILRWDVDKGSPIDTLEGHNDSVYDLTVFEMEEQSYLLSGGADNQAIIWVKDSSDTYILHQRLIGHLGDVLTVDYATSRNLILTGSEDKTVKLWHWQEGQFVEDISPIRHLEKINSAKFSPDGKYIVSGSDDRTMKLWEVE